MPVETRYMHSDKWTVNGLNTWKLTTEIPPSSIGVEQVSDNELKKGYWGMRVWKRDVDGNETELTEGSPVAIVTRDAEGEGLQSNSWDCPLTKLVSTDAIVLRVYTKVEGGEWKQAFFKPDFITEQLNAAQLYRVSWTIYYYTEIAFVWPRYRYFFYWGPAYQYSRVENFKWRPTKIKGQLEDKGYKGKMVEK